MNPLHPSHLTTRERLAAVCEILAGGVVRLRMREAQAADQAETFRLHFVPGESGHANANAEQEDAA